jgi:RNA polymerase sigma factor (sigma-70 family)
MSTQETRELDPEFVRSQLVIARNHEDSCVRARARNRLLMCVMPPLLSLCRRALEPYGATENELASEAVASALETMDRIDTQRAGHFVAIVCARARFRLKDYASCRRENRPLPLHAARRLRKIQSACCDAKDVRSASVPRIARSTGLRPGTVRKLLPFLTAPDVNPAATHSLCDDLADPSESPAECSAQRDFSAAVLRILRSEFHCLTQRQLEVLRLAYPLDGSEALSQSAIAEQVRVTQQRVQALIASALTKLRKQCSAHADVLNEIGVGRPTPT